MAGQDAVRAAQRFNAALDLTGVILTKADGDARGGAALSVREVTGKPIKFVGVGEKIDALEPFHPERMASRILGMGDVRRAGRAGARHGGPARRPRSSPRRSTKGKGFDFTDLASSSPSSTHGRHPGARLETARARRCRPGARPGRRPHDPPPDRHHRLDDPGERRRPAIIDGSRKRRIAAGAGVPVQDVNRLLKQFMQMEKVMKKMRGGGLAQDDAEPQGRSFRAAAGRARAGRHPEG